MAKSSNVAFQVSAEMLCTDKHGAVSVKLDIATALVTDAGRADGARQKAVEMFRSAPVSWEYHKALRSAFIAGVAETYPTMSADAKAKRWERLCVDANYKAPKSTSKAAVKMAEKRAADKASKVNTDAPASPANGADAAKSVKVELNAIEQNLIKWFRAGQFEMIQSLIAAKSES